MQVNRVFHSWSLCYPSHPLYLLILLVHFSNASDMWLSNTLGNTFTEGNTFFFLFP
jgi:hypothetical protein